MASRKHDALVAAWKAAHLLFKPLEAKLKAARDAVTAAIVATGADHIETKLGTIALRTRTEVDWQALARSQLAPTVIEDLKPKYAKTSAPYVQAPSDWSAEING
jgi:hypothetical protein